MAFNTIGWKPTNIFFAALDAILGDPQIQGNAYDGEEPAETLAFVRNSRVDSAGPRASAAVSARRSTRWSRTTPPPRRPPSWARPA